MSLNKSALLALSFTTALITAYFAAKGSLFAVLSLLGTIALLHKALDGMASTGAKIMISVAMVTGLSSMMVIQVGAEFGILGVSLAGMIMFGGLQGLRALTEIRDRPSEEDVLENGEKTSRS